MSAPTEQQTPLAADLDERRSVPAGPASRAAQVALTAHESARVAALDAFDVLDSAPEETFDALTRIAAEICNTPIALVSLVDRDRQWFKARVGLEATETAREHAFCAHAIQSTSTMVVEDATLDDRFADNPLVTCDPHVRFYAGAPLITADGYAIGALCVLDTSPRGLDERQFSVLSNLASQVVALLELRAVTVRLNRVVRTQQAADAALRHEATHDQMTGLANRRRFFAELERRSSTGAVGVVFVDVDGLKGVNDHHGHHVGDLLLTRTAHDIRRAVRVEDLVARLGGDEFAVLTDVVDPEELDDLIRRVREVVCGPVTLCGVPLVAGASVGGAVSFPGEDAGQVVQRSDEAMYVQKRLRRTDPRLGATETDSVTARRAPIPDALEAAVRISNDGIMSFEAVRNERGDISDFRWRLVNRRACEIVGRPE